MTKNIRTDKLDTATALLEDAILGYFAGHSVQTTIHLSHAVYTIIRDLNIHYRDKLEPDPELEAYEEIEARFLENEDPKETRERIKRHKQYEAETLGAPANYLKHADRDPFAEAAYNEEDSWYRLSLAISAHRGLVDTLIQQSRLTTAAAILDLSQQDKRRPKYLILQELFDEFTNERESISDPFWQQHDFEALSTITEELKAKYAQITAESDLWMTRSKHDQLVALDTITEKTTKTLADQPKPNDPAQ